MKLWSSKNPAHHNWTQDWLKKRTAQEIADIVLALSNSPAGWSGAGKLDAERASPERLADLIVDTLYAGDNDTRRLISDLIEHMQQRIETKTENSPAGPEDPD